MKRNRVATVAAAAARLPERNERRQKKDSKGFDSNTLQRLVKVVREDIFGERTVLTPEEVLSVCKRAFARSILVHCHRLFIKGERGHKEIINKVTESLGVHALEVFPKGTSYVPRGQPTLS